MEGAERGYTQLFSKIGDQGRGKSLEDIVVLIQGALWQRMPWADVEQLDAAIRYIARRAKEYARPPRNRYRPKVNDALDLELLYAVPRPAVVCSADKRFLNLVSQLVGAEFCPVVHPQELPSVLRELSEQSLHPDS